MLIHSFICEFTECAHDELIPCRSVEDALCRCMDKPVMALRQQIHLPQGHGVPGSTKHYGKYNAAKDKGFLRILMLNSLEDHHTHQPTDQEP